MVSTASAARVASAALTPCSEKVWSLCCSEPAKRQRPTMPVTMIITAAYNVSRGKPMLGVSSAIISETMSATSMTVTATANTSVP